MIRMVNYESRLGLVLLQEVPEMVAAKEAWTIFDYDPYLKQFSSFRYAWYRVEINPYLEFLPLLEQHKEARLFRTLSHEPVVTDGKQSELNRRFLNLYELADHQRITVDGAPYIDPFGFHVYTHTWLSLDGTGSDIDLRELPEQEVFK